MPNLLTTAFAALRYPSAANNGAEFAEGVGNLADDVDQLLAPSHARVTVATALPSDPLAWTVFAWSAAPVRVGGDWWAVTPNPTRLVAPRAGVYVVTALAAPSAGGFRFRVRIETDDATLLAESEASGVAGSSSASATSLWFADAGDYVEVSARAVASGSAVTATLAAKLLV